jgi:hypothetical protein
MPQRLFNMLNTPANKFLLRTSLPSILSLSMFGLSLGISSTIFAASISYQQAEQSVLQDSYSTQATQALQQASKLEAEAVKGLGLPRIDLNVRAYAFHNELDVPLGALKNNLEHTLTDGVATKIDEWQNTYPNVGDLSGLEQGIDQTIHKGVGLIPNSSQITLEDQVIRPTISAMMPLYTGGLTSSAKQVANIKAKRSELNTKQQQDLQRFELIQAYFNVQLQKQLLASSQYNWHAMQKHYDNALKLEQQGFISKGQRMQFEVAKNNAQRSEQASQANLKASLFQLNNLLQSSQITELTTPLFINSTQNQDLNTLLKSYADQSALVQKLLYGYIDASDFYANPIAVQNRSIMNVPFTLANPDLEKLFLKEAEENHLLNLAGHRSVGGMRASIYNAVPLEGVQALVNFMDDFAKRNA